MCAGPSIAVDRQERENVSRTAGPTLPGIIYTPSQPPTLTPSHPHRCSRCRWDSRPWVAEAPRPDRGVDSPALPPPTTPAQIPPPFGPPLPPPPPRRTPFPLSQRSARSQPVPPSGRRHNSRRLFPRENTMATDRVSTLRNWVRPRSMILCPSTTPLAKRSTWLIALPITGSPLPGNCC